MDNAFTELGYFILQGVAHLPDGEREKRIAFILHILPIGLDDLERSAQPEAMKQAYADWLKNDIEVEKAIGRVRKMVKDVKWRNYISSEHEESNEAYTKGYNEGTELAVYYSGLTAGLKHGNNSKA